MTITVTRLVPGVGSEIVVGVVVGADVDALLLDLLELV